MSMRSGYRLHHALIIVMCIRNGLLKIQIDEPYDGNRMWPDTRFAMAHATEKHENWKRGSQ